MVIRELSSKFFIKILVLLGISLNSNSLAKSFQNYPLSVGDYWEYKDTMFQDVLTLKIVNDTLMSNGKSYAQFEGGWIRYQRYENSCVYFYDSKYEQEYLLFDFNAVPHTKIITHVRGEDTTDVYFNGVLPDSLRYLNRKDSLWKFSVDWDRRTIDEEVYYRIADSMGIAIMYGFMWRYELMGAIISKDTIGSVLNISNRIKNNYRIFYLQQNYPNPFNPRTVISYQLPVISNVEMSIYNLLGQKVATLVNERQQAGSYQVEWDASRFSSGIYYYRIKVGEYQDVKKMILLR